MVAQLSGRTELYTLKMWILWYAISIISQQQFFLKKIEEIRATETGNTNTLCGPFL